MAGTNEVASKIAEITGAPNTSSETVNDFIIDDLVPQAVCYPGSLEEAAQVLALANGNGWTVSPRGAGTKQRLGNQPRSLHVVLGTGRLNHIIEYEPDELTMTVEAGAKLADVQAAAKPKHQFLPLDPPRQNDCTVGGVLAANSSGPRRLHYGTARDLVIGLRVAHITGEVTKSGGKVVKNVAGYDMKKLYIGSLGTLAVIGQTTFKLYPLPETEQTVASAFKDLRNAEKLIKQITSSFLEPFALELLNQTAAKTIGENFGISEFEQSYLVLVGFGNVPQAVNRQVTDVEKEAARQDCSKAEVIAGPEHDKVWRMISEYHELCKPGLIVKISVLPSKVRETFEEVEQESSKHGLKPELISHAGTGIIYMYHRTIDEVQTGLTEFLNACRSQAIASGGSLVIEDAPVWLKKKIDVWGPVRNDFKLMKAIKEQFDPKAILNPGRFVGGI